MAIFLAIVPNLPEGSTAAERKTWRENRVKNYKIRFIDKPSMDWVPGGKTSASGLHRYNTTLHGIDEMERPGLQKAAVP
jgi:hypothetical protein